MTATLNQSCVAQYRLNECRRDLAVRDSRGRYHGIAVRNTQFTSVDGQYGAAMEFNGTTDKVTVPTASAINFGTGDFSICFRVKRSNAGCDLVKKFHNEFLNSNGFRISIGSGFDDINKVTVSFGSSVYLAGNTLSSDVWYHVTVVFDRDGYLKIYLNGVCTYQTSIAGVPTIDVTEDLILGESLDGVLENVCLFGRVLTAAEITVLQTTEFLAGPFETAAEKLAEMVADCASFAAECATDAVGFVHVGSYDVPDASAAWPMALVSRTGNDRSKCVGTGAVLHGGTLELRIEKAIPTASQSSDDAALEEFGRWADAVQAELWELSHAAGGLMINSIETTQGPLRYDDEAHVNLCCVYWTVDWGFGQ